jgi:hypothetical protein
MDHLLIPEWVGYPALVLVAIVLAILTPRGDAAELAKSIA